MKNISEDQALTVVILAAGQGKRMGSDLPKVLTPIGGQAMLHHVYSASHQLIPQQSTMVVYGYEGQKVRQALDHHTIQWIHQAQQLGTGHAALQALKKIPEHHQVLILYGDVPLIRKETLKRFITETPLNSLGIITANFEDPTGIGRIIRDNQNHIVKVIEEKDADAVTRQIKEVNTGFYTAPARYLKDWLSRLANHNAQQEYYLTDIIALAVKDNIPVVGMPLINYQEALGVNNLMQLALAEQLYNQFEQQCLE